MLETDVVEKIETHSLVFPSENRTLYEVMWENTVEPDGPQIDIRVIRRMRFACRITKARTHALIILNIY